MPAGGATHSQHIGTFPPAATAGVYVGCMYSEYTQLQYSLGYKLSPGLVTGNGISYLVGRVSYTFGLQGGVGRAAAAAAAALKIAVHALDACMHELVLAMQCTAWWEERGVL